MIVRDRKFIIKLKLGNHKNSGKNYRLKDTFINMVVYLYKQPNWSRKWTEQTTANNKNYCISRTNPDRYLSSTQT